MGENIFVLLLLFPSSWSEMESQFEDRMGEKNTSSSYLEMAGIRCASNCDSLAIINTAWDYFRPRLRANNSLLFECRVAGSFIFILQYRICVVVVLTYSSCDACPDPNPRNQQRLDSGCSVLFLIAKWFPYYFLSIGAPLHSLYSLTFHPVSHSSVAGFFSIVFQSAKSSVLS